ncbi:pumilio [Anaeramoeba flamelloides]|uniref:Pumilio n=1 Tax=Anaeramoeba flamelloides TaxID=1746091 RepID=A0ABQ8XML7_9EUKA|nr:pumilio [Anaeramoeba flamelloides]
MNFSSQQFNQQRPRTTQPYQQQQQPLQFHQPLQPHSQYQQPITQQQTYNYDNLQQDKRLLHVRTKRIKKWKPLQETSQSGFTSSKLQQNQLKHFDQQNQIPMDNSFYTTSFNGNQNNEESEKESNSDEEGYFDGVVSYSGSGSGTSSWDEEDSGDDEFDFDENLKIGVEINENKNGEEGEGKKNYTINSYIEGMGELFNEKSFIHNFSNLDLHSTIKNIKNNNINRINSSNENFFLSTNVGSLQKTSKEEKPQQLESNLNNSLDAKQKIPQSETEKLRPSTAPPMSLNNNLRDLSYIGVFAENNRKKSFQQFMEKNILSNKPKNVIPNQIQKVNINTKQTFQNFQQQQNKQNHGSEIKLQNLLHHSIKMKENQNHNTIKKNGENIKNTLDTKQNNSLKYTNENDWMNRQQNSELVIQSQLNHQQLPLPNHQNQNLQNQNQYFNQYSSYIQKNNNTNIHYQKPQPFFSDQFGYNQMGTNDIAVQQNVKLNSQQLGQPQKQRRPLHLQQQTMVPQNTLIPRQQQPNKMQQFTTKNLTTSSLKQPRQTHKLNSKHGGYMPNTYTSNNHSQSENQIVSLDELIGKIYINSQNQYGCRNLQNLLETNDKRTFKKIFKELKNHFGDLMMDQFGNYLCQKLFDYCSKRRIYAILKEISNNCILISTNIYGTRAVQKLIENISDKKQEKIFFSSIKNDLISLINNANGGHVIQKCFTAFPIEKNNVSVFILLLSYSLSLSLFKGLQVIE